MKVDFRQLYTQESIDELHYAIGPECSEDIMGHESFMYPPEGCTCEMWGTKGGIEMPIWLMTENHLQNSLQMLFRVQTINTRNQGVLADDVEALRQWNKDSPDQDQGGFGSLFKEQMYLSTQEERVRQGISRLRDEVEARASSRSLWNATGDVKDWSPEGIDELVQKIMNGRPFG